MINTISSLAIALMVLAGMNNPAKEQPGHAGQGGGNRQKESVCECKDEKPEQPGKTAEHPDDKDRNAGQSPYVSCKRRANRTPGCQCTCPNDNQEGVEVKTGPYGLKQKPKKPG